jgi:hypothetical protein
LVDRFAGREGLVDFDKKWTTKVTDVRNFYQFSASERYREDGTEHEHYSDSAGKSGGQKEKLAYTVLAASLAYQFGLEWGEVKSRSFRFVVIDEAFGRGSDESARFGLDLFKQLNLQLLIVTPKQKIHVIEPYIANVGFDSKMGARPIDRKIDELIRVPLSQKILFEGISDCTVRAVMTENETIEFEIVTDKKIIKTKEKTIDEPEVDERGYIILNQFKPNNENNKYNK